MLRALIQPEEDPMEGEYISVDGHISVDQQPYIKAIVKGSKQVMRDPRDGAEAILDPTGDREYARDARKGQWEDFCYCSSPTHEGERWLPSTQFTTDPNTESKFDRQCRKCRADAAYERRLKDAERRGIRLRDKPGRPPKMKGREN